MRILVHGRSGVPFTVQLGRELSHRGYDVLFSYGAFFQSPKGYLSREENDPLNFQIEAIDLRKPFKKYSYIKRHFQEIEYAKKLVDQIYRYDPDVILISGSHPDALEVVYKKCKKLDIKIVLWLQDIYSIAIKRILKNRFGVLGDIVGIYYSIKEKWLLRQSDEVIIITEDFYGLMKKWEIDDNSIHVIHNWAPVNELPVRAKENSWAMQHNLTDKFCFLYSGTLGLKHNPDLLLQLSLHYLENPNTQIVVISEGLGADWLRDKKKELGLRNLKLLNFQPHENMPDVLGTADVLVAILEPDAGIYSAPSKVLTYLCAERPLLLAIPSDNLSARIVSENDAGEVINPSECTEFLEAADKLYNNPAIRLEYGQNARIYAENRFNISVICDQFELIIGNN